MNVLALHLAAPGDYPTACQIYRTNIPFHELSLHGWGADWIYWNEVIAAYQRQGRQAWIDAFLPYDLIVLPRAVAPTANHRIAVASLVELLRRLNKKVVYEVDDDFTNDHRDLTPMGIHDAMQIASWCDAVTVTTPFLADLMRQRTKRPVYVLPNMVDSRLWQAPMDRMDKSVTIGLSGSSTHEHDWRVLETVLPRILADFPSVKLSIAAFHPDYLQGLPRTDYVPGMSYPEYSLWVRSCDLILAPVDPDDGFNLGKSCVKVTEGQVAGAACIATDNPVYRLAITHGRTGLLTPQTPDGWTDALASLLTDPGRRTTLAQAGRRWALKHHDIRTQWVHWARCYQQIVRKAPNRCALPLPDLTLDLESVPA